MRLNSVIHLVSTQNRSNSMGDDIEIGEKSRKVFAEKKSIRQSEFYQAASTGFKPEVAFQIWTKEYKGEQKLLYKERLYSIIRTYEKGESIELIGEGAVNIADA